MDSLIRDPSGRNCRNVLPCRHIPSSNPVPTFGYPREDIPEILGGKLKTLPKNVRETTRIPLGNYRGLRFGIVLHPQFPPDVYLEGSTTRQTSLSREHQGPRTVLNALERLANAYGSDCDRVRQDLSIAEAQLRDYQARLGNIFTLETYLLELTALRDQLKAGLSSTAHQPDKAEGPSVSEIAERIKAMKAANSIEATPQRARAKTLFRRGAGHCPHPSQAGRSKCRR